MKRRKEENGSSYGDYKLFLSKDGLEVVKVDCGVVSIPPFRIDVPSFSESVQFGAQTTRAELDDKIKLGEVLRPLHLPPGQYLGSKKILKILIVCNNVNEIGWIFQIVLLNLEGFKDGKQFLVMCVIIQLRHSKSAEVKSN